MTIKAFKRVKASKKYHVHFERNGEIKQYIVTDEELKSNFDTLLFHATWLHIEVISSTNREVA